MIYDKIIEDAIIKSTDLEDFIESGKLQIVFGDVELLEEFNVNLKDEGFKISVRNKYDNGASGKEIPHDPTVKIIAGTKFRKDGMLGLPITIEDKPKIYKECDNKYNRTESRPYMKATKKFIKSNKDILDEYWDLNPKSNKDSKRMKEIENIIRGKYE